MNRVSTVTNSWARKIARRDLTFVTLLGLCAVLFTGTPVQAQISAESDRLLHRMSASTDFDVKTFGPARWLDGAAGRVRVAQSNTK